MNNTFSKTTYGGSDYLPAIKEGEVTNYEKPLQTVIQNKPSSEIQILDFAAYDLPSSLAYRDICLENIETQIKRKKKMLLEKKKLLDEAIKQNSYLNGVKNDYLIYYNYIIKKKEEELEALQKINNYTQELIMNTDSTEEEIKNLKKEQDRILYEMKNIKKSLQVIIGKS